MEDLASTLQGVYQQYPRLQQYGFQAARVDKPDARGQLEFFPPDELYNPRPGVPFIEVYNPNLQGADLQRAVFGDALHYLPHVDKNFAKMRDDFVNTITPEQSVVDRSAYNRARSEHGETRPYDRWFDLNRKDAYIRGYLAPDAANEWANVYTDQQRSMLDAMRAYLQAPQ